MNKRIGIITLNGYFNYGNRLQNYALQEVLKSYGFLVETILVKVQKEEKEKGENYKIELILKYIKSILKFVLRYKRHEKIRTQRFLEFSKKHIHETDFFIFENNVPSEVVSKYDFFVTGSDQVWNPEYNGMSSVYFLTFAPKSKRISYAASFGISDLPNESIQKYKKWLSEIKYLSVREEAGAKIVKELTGRDAEVHLDPTLLLTKEEWMCISRESPNKPKAKYILTYFLGNISEVRQKIINDIAEEYQLEVVSLANIKDKRTYIADPSEFLDYIDSAELILTDSFHGSVFSILFEKPFIVFEREGHEKPMTSRLDTLLSKFQLQSRKWGNIGKNEIFEVDYSHIPDILERERKKALNYLEKALEIREIK
mgnify:CR=1 FL=1